jgi:hypothetical protein
MTPKILIHGSGHYPQRFWFGKVVTTEDAMAALIEAGWLMHDHSESEMNALLDLGGEGCCGDWKDKFKTMYGKEIRRVENVL